MIELAPKKDCTGCMACVQTCPINVISIAEDELGDRYPVIDHTRCVKCGKCQKACPSLIAPAVNVSQKAYAVWSLNEDSRKASASGGAAAELYLQALENGWHICGARYNDQLQVVHTVGTTVSDVNAYRQSKYVSSDMSTTYEAIRKLLDNGEHVLCISLPCKIAALLRYLGKSYDNLVTADIVCHGTPPDKQLQEHIAQFTDIREGVLLRFREDNQFLFSLEQSQKTICRHLGKSDMYLAAFLEGLNYRPSCYSCAYAKAERVADMTLCDFWGLGQEIPFNHPYSGSISAVLINTKKGETFFETARARFFAEERSVEEAVKGNAQLQHPTPMHPKRKEFEELYCNVGLEKASAICLKETIQSEKRSLRRIKLRNGLRALAGVFIKRYRR